VQEEKGPGAPLVFFRLASCRHGCGGALILEHGSKLLPAVRACLGARERLWRAILLVPPLRLRYQKWRLSRASPQGNGDNRSLYGFRTCLPPLNEPWAELWPRARPDAPLSDRPSEAFDHTLRSWCDRTPVLFTRNPQSAKCQKHRLPRDQHAPTVSPDSVRPRLLSVKY